MSYVKKVLDTAQKCNISIERVKKSQRKTSSRLEGSVVTSTVGERRSAPDDKDGLRKNIFHPILDYDWGVTEIILQALLQHNERRSTEQLFRRDTPFCSQRSMSQTYDLRHKLHQAKRILERKSKGGMQSLTSILDFTVFLEPFK